jgi:proteasome lid subunit RPN8/RPN11
LVTLKSDVSRRIVRHAREAAPAECCGLLVGYATHVVDAIPTRNIATSPTRFLIDPKEHIDGRREARRRGLDVIGFYHSHPHSEAQPSARDRDESSYPDHLYMIVGMCSEPPDVRVFIPGEGTFREVPLVID